MLSFFRKKEVIAKTTPLELASAVIDKTQSLGNEINVLQLGHLCFLVNETYFAKYNQDLCDDIKYTGTGYYNHDIYRAYRKYQTQNIQMKAKNKFGVTISTEFDSKIQQIINHICEKYSSSSAVWLRTNIPNIEIDINF